MDTLNGSNSPNNNQATGQSSLTHKTCDDKLETHVTPVENLFELNSQSNQGLSQKQSKVATYQPPEPKVKSLYPVRNVDINDNFGNQSFQGAPIITASLQLSVKNHGQKKSIFNQSRLKPIKPNWPLAIIQNSPQQIKAVTVPKVKQLNRPLSQQSGDHKTTSKIGTLPLVMDQTGTPALATPQYQPKDTFSKKTGDTGAFTALLSVEDLANKYGGFKKQEQKDGQQKQQSPRIPPRSKAQTGHNSESKDISENNPLAQLNDNLLAIQNLQGYMINTIGTSSDNRRTRDPNFSRNAPIIRHGKAGLKPKVIGSIPDRKLALRSVDVEESLVAGRENHIVTNALSVKGTRKTPFIGLKKRLNHNSHWSANPDNYKKRQDVNISPEQSRHSSWLYSPGLHPVLPKQMGSTNLQQNHATRESLAQTTSRTLGKQISLGHESKQQGYTKFELERISDQALIGWFPQTSVKTPNEKKPGMKMSTYGGDKRRPKEDRYFESDETLRASVNERSFGAVEYSEATIPDRIPSKGSNRVQILGNAAKTTIARQLDQIKVQKNLQEALSGEQTATHSRKISRFRKIINATGTNTINATGTPQLSYLDSREEPTRPRLFSPPEQTVQEASVTSPTGGEMFLVQKMRQQMSPREYAQTAKFKRRNRAKRYDRSYLPDLYAIESADRNQKSGLPLGLEYKDGMNFGALSAINKSIDTENSNERTFSGKRRSEQIVLDLSLRNKKQAVQIQENSKPFQNRTINQRIKQSVKRKKSIKQQEDYILKSLESNENVKSDVESAEEVAERIVNQEIPKQDTIQMDQKMVKQSFHKQNESLISYRDESSDDDGSRDYAISKFTQGLNHDFDQQIASIDTDPESARGDISNEPVGQGGIGIFEPLNREIIIKRMKELNQRDKTAPKQMPLPQKRDKIFEQISKRDASVYTNRGRKDTQQSETQDDVRTNSQMRQSMINAREQIQQAKRKTCHVLIDYKDTPAKKQHFWLHPGKSTQIPFKPFVFEYAAVAIFQKQQPLVIRLYGMKDDVNVFLSTSEKYPDEQLCQTSYKNNRRFEFYTKEAQGNRAATFKTQFLFLAIESASETPIRVRVSFGVEKKKTLDTNEEEEPDDADIMKQISTHGPTRKKDDVLNTAARNANEHQKRIRLQVEQLVGDRKGAEDFVDGAKETQRKRVVKEREQAQQRNYVAENKQDAGVWRDLEAFTRQELHAQHAVRLKEASTKAQELETQKRVEAEHALQKRDNLRAIRDHVGQIINQHKEGLIRLKEMTSYVVIREYLKRAIHFYTVRRDYRRKVQQQILAGLFIFVKIRIHLRRQGPFIEMREQNFLRRHITLNAQLTIENTKVRAGKLLARALRDSREPFQLKLKFRQTYQGWTAIMERMRQYFAAGRAQKQFLLLYLSREKKRICNVISNTKGLEPSMKKFCILLQSTAESYLVTQINIYFEKCKENFLEEFITWRKETAKLKYYDYQDNRFYWRQPLIAPRVIWSFEEINYEPDPSPLLQALRKQCTQLAFDNYEYFLKPEVKQSPEELEQIIQAQIVKQKKRAYEELVQTKQINLFKTALSFEGLSPHQVGIELPPEKKPSSSLVVKKKESAEIETEVVEKIKLCHFPDRPQLKYLATGPMLHVLLLQACKDAFPDMEEQLQRADKKAKR